MKFTYLLSMLLISSAAVKAQVFSFTPTIRFTSSYYSFKKGIDLTSAIDTLCKVGRVTIDLENKTISNPESIETPLGLFPIKSVSYDAANRMYRLDAVDPYLKHKFLYFNVKLDNNDQVIYVKKVKRHTGGTFRGDTSFSTFTNSLKCIEFSVNSSRMKENLMLSADSAENIKQLNEVYDAGYEEQKTRVEMREGVFSWTEGKGGNMKYHSYPVDEIRLKNEAGVTEGFELRCNVSESVYYMILKVRTRRKMVDRQSGWEEVIVIAKFEDGIRTAFSVIQG